MTFWTIIFRMNSETLAEFSAGLLETSEKLSEFSARLLETFWTFERLERIPKDY